MDRRGTVFGGYCTASRRCHGPDGLPSPPGTSDASASRQGHARDGLPSLTWTLHSIRGGLPSRSGLPSVMDGAAALFPPHDGRPRAARDGRPPTEMTSTSLLFYTVSLDDHSG